MYPRTVSIAPTRQVASGAMDIFVAGFRQDHVEQMQVGFSVICDATEAQAHEAMSFVEANGGGAVAEIETMQPEVMPTQRAPFPSRP